MGIAIVFIIVLLLISFIAMVVSIGFDKPRLMNFFYLACMALGAVALVLSFIGMLLN